MVTKLQAGLIATGINIVAIAILFRIIDIVNTKVMNKIRNEENNSPLLRFIPIFMKILKVLIIFVAITGILQSQGYSMSSIIAGFGIGGLAVGMAAKETIANVFGSISILTDHVYKIGDYVKVNGIEGYVEDVNIRSTKIRDLDNFLITVPNNVAANAVITNVSKAKKRLLKIVFGVTYSTSNDSIQKVHEILKEIAINHKDIHNDFTIAIHDLGESSINIRFVGYVKTGSYFKFLKVRGEFLQLAVAKFRENNIDFAFPSRSIYIESDKIEN
ncbi:mechanosensitive ion channel family protein [bacterium]|nr:mechanosensitive ion channel family protein [bacterium]